MRTIDSTIVSAQAESTYRPCARMDVYKTRTFWTEITRYSAMPQLDIYSASPDSNETPPETVRYSTTLGKTWGAFAYWAYPLIYQEGDASPVSLSGGTVACVPNMRPGIAEVGGTGYCFYLGIDGGIKRVTFSLSPFGGSQSTTTVATGYDMSTAGSIVAIDAFEFVVFYKKNCNSIGVRIYSYISSWTMREMPGSFIFPQNKYIDTRWLNFSGAVRVPNKHICVYLTNMKNGEVLGRKVKTTALADPFYDGDWSDIFTAVPTDIGDNKGLTMLRLTHVGYSTLTGQPYLVGQFWRTQEMKNGVVYSAVLHSVDYGETFYYDRNSIFTSLVYRFYLLYSSTKVFAASKNHICEANTFYPFGNTSIGVEKERMLKVEGTDRDITVTIANGDNYYTKANTYLVNGSRVVLQLGCYTSTGATFSNYGIYIIRGVSRVIRDGGRHLSVKLTHEAVFRTEHMSQPYYTELEAKSTIQTKLEDAGQVYPAMNSGAADTELNIDFWKAKPHTPDYVPYSFAYTPEPIVFGTDSVAPYSFTGAHTGCCKVELGDISFLSSLPVVTTEPFYVYVAYWSKYDASTVDNDDVYVWLQMEKPSGERYVVGGSLYTANRNTACTYPTSIAGESYAVAYSFSSSDIEIGDKIHTVYFAWTAPTATTMCPVRFSISPISIIYTDDHSGNWLQLSPGGMEVPRLGRPYVMFLSKPYSSLTFSIEGRFEFLVGTTSATTINGSRLAWGVIGLAEDAQNYFCARYNVTNSSSRFELVKVVNGVETILASTTSHDALGTSIGTHWIMLKHENGVFRAWLRTEAGEYAATPSITYTWTPPNSWTPMTPWKNYHVGFYGHKQTPAIRIVSFNSSKGRYMGILPGQYDDLTDFPASGQVVVDDYRYTYTEVIPKAGTYLLGPYRFQSQQTYGKYANPYDGTIFGEQLVEDYFTVITMLNWISNPTYHEYYKDKILALSNGYNYKISSTDWKAWARDDSGAVIPLPTKSFWYTGWKTVRNMGGSLSDKVYVTCGLGGVVRVGGSDVEFAHPEGSLAMVYANDRIKCLYVAAQSGARDGVIADMVKQIAGRAGAVAAFPGNGTYSSLSLTTLPQDI